ncbi:CU044_5270 family protein [Streptomyces sp. NPDC001928]|uniref:CU044_5270 family protein n=1 Tax=Streptomyces sp. NPDC001928 TaxID=3154404 RepID=UPI003324F581
MNQLPERDLPPGSHRLLKEHLMTEIRRAEQPARLGAKWLRPALAAAAVATAAAVTFVVLPSSGSGSGPGSGSGASAQQPAKTAVAVVLEDIALAAEDAGDSYGEIRDDQFVYIERKASYARFETGKKTQISPLRQSEMWTSVDGTRKGMIRQEGRQWATDPDGAPGEPGSELSGTYRNLSKLPTDADKMYAWLKKMGPKNSGQETSQAMFVLVGDLIRNALVPPEQGAAIFRAVARIPGVKVVENAVDAAGRRGVAITRDDPDNPTRDEWIFDVETHEYLGERTVATEDFSDIKQGQVIGNSAILDRAVVDRAGQRP